MTENGSRWVSASANSVAATQISSGAMNSARVITCGVRASSAVVVTHSKAAYRNSANATAWMPEKAPLSNRFSG